MCNGKAYYYLPIDVNCKIFVIIKYDKCSRIMIKYLIKILLLTWKIKKKNCNVINIEDKKNIII